MDPTSQPQNQNDDLNLTNQSQDSNNLVNNSDVASITKDSAEATSSTGSFTTTNTSASNTMSNTSMEEDMDQINPASAAGSSLSGSTSADTISKDTISADPTSTDEASSISSTSSDQFSADLTSSVDSNSTDQIATNLSSSVNPTSVDQASITSSDQTSMNQTSTNSTSPELDNLMNELNNYQPENGPSVSTEHKTTDLNNPVNSESTNNFGSTSNLGSTNNLSSPLADTNNSTANQPAFGSTQASVAPTSLDMTSSSIDVDDQTSTNATNNQAPAQNTDDDSEDQPITAAAPVPGSIGSAVSYSDVEKKQAEEALKEAKNQNKPKFKFTRTTILIIIIVVLLVITGIVVAFIFLNDPKKVPTEASGKNNVVQATTKTLTCVRPLTTNETAEVGAGYGNFERHFIFNNGNLDSINENYIYQFDNADAATSAKTNLDNTLKSANNTQFTTTVNVNQLKKTSTIPSDKLDDYLKNLSELSSVTSRDLNSFLAAENQTGLSCSTVE